MVNTKECEKNTTKEQSKKKKSHFVHDVYAVCVMGVDGSLA